MLNVSRLELFVERLLEKRVNCVSATRRIGSAACVRCGSKSKAL